MLWRAILPVGCLIGVPFLNDDFVACKSAFKTRAYRSSDVAPEKSSSRFNDTAQAEHLLLRHREWLSPMLSEHGLLRNLVHGYFQDAEVSYHGVQTFAVKNHWKPTDYANV